MVQLSNCILVELLIPEQVHDEMRLYSEEMCCFTLSESFLVNKSQDFLEFICVELLLLPPLVQHTPLATLEAEHEISGLLCTHLPVIYSAEFGQDEVLLFFFIRISA